MNFYISSQVTKKLAGHAARTAAWCTNIGSEHGQVLMSVLTAAEGHGLREMAKGLMQRYREAHEPPPRLMYVDRDCCTQFGGCMMLDMFSECPQTVDQWLAEQRQHAQDKNKKDDETIIL